VDVGILILHKHYVHDDHSCYMAKAFVYKCRARMPYIKGKDTTDCTMFNTQKPLGYCKL